jgi:hypothetical protein
VRVLPNRSFYGSDSNFVDGLLLILHFSFSVFGEGSFPLFTRTCERDAALDRETTQRGWAATGSEAISNVVTGRCFLARGCAKRPKKPGRAGKMKMEKPITGRCRKEREKNGERQSRACDGPSQNGREKSCESSGAPAVTSTADSQRERAERKARAALPQCRPGSVSCRVKRTRRGLQWAIFSFRKRPG